MQKSVERLSTGKRINHPKDDPAGFIAAEGLRKELTDLKVKLRGITGERQQSQRQQSGLANIQQALLEVRDRLAAVGDDAITADERAALEFEISEATRSLARIARISGISGFDADAFDASSLDALDGQSHSVTSQRVALAAHDHTHLETFQRLYEDQIVITTQTLSLIEDTDFAAETAELAQSQVLSQGAMAALVYSTHQRVDQITSILDEMV